ncbi:MepB family protein [Burkholderia pseudomallei]|uniref:MepB family protein n=2 Tax=Burkholderia pseudomallei TaxID=28450 RepID=UPI001F167A1B|nr:MepB family protein [Burkholderia pseudomallei]
MKTTLMNRKGCKLVLAPGDFPPSLVATIRDVFEPAGLNVSSLPLREVESFEYGACRLGLDGHTVAFREAKTTPTKIGQFVTLWKRPKPGAAIEPLDISDCVDFVVVYVFDAMQRGHFVFPQKILVEKGVMSSSGKVGKRAIRVYPPWINPVANEAIRTQKWQLRHFFHVAQDGTANSILVRELFKRSVIGAASRNSSRSATEPKPRDK